MHTVSCEGENYMNYPLEAVVKNRAETVVDEILVQNSSFNWNLVLKRYSHSKTWLSVSLVQTIFVIIN